MRKLMLLTVPALLTVAAQAGAVTLFSANLTTAQETTPVPLTTETNAPRAMPFGTASFVLNDAGNALSFMARITNIDFTGSQTADRNDNLAAAHIHASATSVPGVAAGVVWGFFGNPFNDNAPNDVVTTPFGTGVGGTISGKWDLAEGNGTTLSAQLPNLLANRGYINFHTFQNPGGEIRGQILLVPEPATYALFGIGLLAVAGLSSRRRR
jgi:hypothetical protein